MSSSDRRSVLQLLAGVPLLAACGFTPAYGPQGIATKLRGRVEYEEPKSGPAFNLVKQFTVHFGRPEAATHRLNYSISTSTQSGGFSSGNAITRYLLNGSVTWSLEDLASQERVAGGTVSSFTSWSAAGSTISGLSAQEDAEDRLMIILADQIADQILAQFSGLKP